MLKEFIVVSPAATTIVLFVVVAAVVCSLFFDSTVDTTFSAFFTVGSCHCLLWLATSFSYIADPLTELVDVLSEDLLGKLLAARDIQHAIELVSGASLLDLPHHMMDPITPIKLNEQVNELSLEDKQQCFVPINIHIYEDKFLNYITTKDVSQVKDVTICGLPMSENSVNTVMEESHTL